MVLVNLVLAVHLLWMAWVVLGGFWTRGRPGWGTFHVLSLMWGIVAEVGPWPCPLTLAEQWAMGQAGVQAFRGDFLEHYLSAVVYPNLPVTWIITGAVFVCALNLGIYVRRGTRWWMTRHAGQQMERI